MRLLRLTTLYPAYLARFYASRPALASSRYAEQQRALEHDAFGWADFWRCALAPLGYDTMDVVANARPMQEAWRREAGGVVAGDPLLGIAASQAAAFRPEVLFLDDYITFTASWIGDLRARVPSIRLVIGWCGAPFRDPEVFRAYDLVLSCVPELVDRFRGMGQQSEQLHHAFDPRVLQRLGAGGGEVHDFTFVGQLVAGAELHRERARTLERLAAALPITVFTPAAERSVGGAAYDAAKRALWEAVRLARAAGVPERELARLPGVGRMAVRGESGVARHSATLRGRMRPAVYGLDMFRTLRASRATFNQHIDLSARSASNMRLFESTGVGTCLVTDWKPNLPELFEPDREVVAYRSVGECIEKVRWLLDHPAERDAIAAAGQRRTLAAHSFSHRAPLLDAHIRAALA